MLAYTTHLQRYLGSNPRAWLEGGLHHKSNLFPVRRHTSLLHFPPNQQACTYRSFVCQTLAWLREPACSGVGLTIDITVLPELSVCFLHSLTLSFYSRAHCAPRGTAHLSFSARHVRPLVSEANESIQKPPRVLLIIGCAFGPRKASKVEKPSSRGVSSLHRWSLCFYQFSGPCPCALSAHMYVCLLLCVYSALCCCHTAAPSQS